MNAINKTGAIAAAATALLACGSHAAASEKKIVLYGVLLVTELCRTARRNIFLDEAGWTPL